MADVNVLTSESMTAISMLGPVTECNVGYSMVGYQRWYSYTILKFNHPPFRHMKKSFTLSFNFAVAFAMVSLGLGIFYNPVQQNQNASGAFNSPSNPSSTSANNPSTSTSSNVQSSPAGNSSIALSVKEDGGVYKWINATTGTENPELNLKINDNNTIQIQNPTDTKHELGIDLQGKEVVGKWRYCSGRFRSSIVLTQWNRHIQLSL